MSTELATPRERASILATLLLSKIGDGEWFALNNYLWVTDVRTTSTEELIVIARALSGDRDKLSNWPIFLETVRLELQDRFSVSRAKQLLIGMES